MGASHAWTCILTGIAVWLSCEAAAGQGNTQIPGPGPLRIEELISWNDAGLEDGFGKSPDWIELTNMSALPVNLAKYGLSDDPAVPLKWQFPPGILVPGDRLVVFASGKPDQSSSSEFHTGFKLASDGELLLIAGPEGVIVDSVELLPTTRPDVSQGRLDGSPDQWRYFEEPTPGEANPGEGFDTIATPVTFSHQAGYYAQPFALELAGNRGDEVRYTLNGDEPSPTATLYTAPLEITDRSLEPNGISMIEGTSIANQHTNGWFPPRGLVPKAVSVRARAFRAGSLAGPVVTRSYFVGLDPENQWKLPIIALTSPPSGLFDYETGIYMLGKVFDQYRAANPNEPLTGHTSANYTQRGRAWSRPGHFEFFETNGHLGIRQNVRLDIQGQSSRSFRQKSFGLQPHGDTSPADSFDYPFFPGLQRRGLGSQREQFKGLRLRNSGNDWDHTMFRDALCHRLVAPLGLDVMTPRPVVVFLNGEFWGLYNLREQGDRESVAEHYGVPLEDIVLAEADGAVKEGMPQAVSSYRELRRLVDARDLSDPQALAEAAALMDIDNFLQYQLAEIYLGNADWPHNNVRYWRGPDLLEGMLDSRPGFDGRWRWMVFDTDLAYGHPWSGGTADATLAAAISPAGRPGLNAPWATALLRGLLENPGVRNDFINRMAGHLNSVFSEDRAKSLVAEMKSAIEPVMSDHIQRWRTSGNNLNGWRGNVRAIEGFARQRPRVVRQHFTREFGLSGTASVTVNVSPALAGIITLHQLRLDSSTPGVDAPVYPWDGIWFTDVPLSLQATPRPGHAFVRWDRGEDGVATMETVLHEDADADFHAHFQRVQPTVPLAATLEYRFDHWDLASPAGSHPPPLRFEQSISYSTTLEAEALLDSEWTGPYDLTDRSRFVGLGTDGIGLRVTGRAADFEGSGFPGAVVLALDTTGLQNVTVAWTAATLKPGQRTTVIALQIAIGDDPFIDLTDSSGDPVRYISSSAADETRFPSLSLPAAALNQPYIELRWRYHTPTGGGTGTGALIRLDDITVIGTPAVDAGQITRIAWSSPDLLTLTFSGRPETEHVLQWSADLKVWQSGETFTTTATGEASLESQITNLPDQVRFARVKRQ